MNDFKLKDLKGKVVIHCKSPSDALSCCRFLDFLGLTWADGSSYKENINNHIYGPETCYDFKNGLYGNIKFYQQNNYTILEWADIVSYLREKT